MSKPIERYQTYFCPVCGTELRIDVVEYDEIVNGIFKSGKTVTETTYVCPKCCWSYWEPKEIE